MMNLNFLSLLLILNSFIHLSNQVDFKNLKPFYCEDNHLNYFNNKEKFIFTIENNFLHLTLKNIQLAFKAPYFGDYDEDEQSEDLIFGNTLSNGHENLANNFVENEYLGIINDKNETYLILKTNSKNDSDCSKLNYISGLIKQSDSSDCYNNVKRVTFEKIKGFNYYFNNDDLILLISYSPSEKKIEIIRMISYKSRSFKISISNYRNIPPLLRSRFKLNIDYEIKMAAIGNVYSNNSKIHYLNLYEIDENFKFYINQIKEVNDRNKIQDFKFEKRIGLNPFNFTNMIGCIDKITDLSQIKGILFKDKKFYLISYRKYWIYESDLIKEKFNLNIENPKAYHLNFTNEDDFLTIEYEMRNSKWIKQLDNEIYFIPYKNSIFQIEYSTNNLILKKSDKELLNYCKGSTIRIEGDDYCFESAKYFKTKLFKDDGNANNYENRRYSISDLFKSTKYNYDSDNDKLLFIFKYTDNLIAFLTIKSIILVDIKLFDKVDNYLKLRSPKDDKEFSFGENNLSKSNSTGYLLISLIVILVLLISIIIFIIYLIILRKQNKTQFDQKLKYLKEKFFSNSKKEATPTDKKIKN